MRNLTARKEYRSPYFSKHPDKHPWRTLAKAIPAGASIFMAMFFVLQMSLQVGAGYYPDSSVWNFYPLMAFAGAIFGFERWWAYEQGPYNPFHERETFTE